MDTDVLAFQRQSLENWNLDTPPVRMTRGGEGSTSLHKCYLQPRFQYRISPFSTLLHIGCYNATRERQYNAPRLIPGAQSAEEEDDDDALGSKEVWGFQMPLLWLSSHGRYTLLPSNA